MVASIIRTRLTSKIADRLDFTCEFTKDKKHSRPSLTRYKTTLSTSSYGARKYIQNHSRNSKLIPTAWKMLQLWSPPQCQPFAHSSSEPSPQPQPTKCKTHIQVAREDMGQTRIRNPRSHRRFILVLIRARKISCLSSRMAL